MSEWYYSKDGAQLGPVSESEVKALLANGSIDAQSSMVWKSGMADWLPAAQVPELMGTPAAADPYAAPASGYEVAAAPVDSSGVLPEIVPGSETIDPMACVKRAFDLAVRHIGPVLLMMVVWIAVSIGVSFVLSIFQGVISIAIGEEDARPLIVMSVISTLINQILSVFLLLGITRFSLNIVSGREASVAQLFGEGRLLLRAFVAWLLFYIAVGIGLVLLIVPGIYIAARYGLFLKAMVDRDCGIMAAFEESSRLTTNNRMNLVLLGLLSFALVILGCLALGVGLLFAYPVIELSWVVAYLWLRYGHRAAMDHPGTTVPMLTPQVR